MDLLQRLQKCPKEEKYKKMDDIHQDLRKRIQQFVSRNQYKHPHFNNLNLHNYHPHLFPHQNLHPLCFGNDEKS